MKKNKLKCFSLIELMVAMAILVIMMGFLFQFTIGAQRIWNASATTTETYEDAQITLQTLADDFENMVHISDISSQGAFTPIFISKQTTGYLDTAFWLTNNKTTAQPEFVAYKFDADKNTLYRKAVETNPSETTKRLQALLGDSNINAFANALNNIWWGDATTVCKKISEFTIEPSSSNETDEIGTSSLYYVKGIPTAIRVSFILKSETTGEESKEISRAFSETLFIPVTSIDSY